LIAVRLLSREEIERELWRRKCRLVREYETAALWKTKTGYHFTVPQEGPDKMCPEYIWRDILDELDRYGASRD